MRRLPGPAVSRPGEGGDSRGSRHTCFGTGREHKLNLRYGLSESSTANGLPGARTQSKLPIEIAAGNRRTSSHVCTQPQTHAFRSGFEPGTNVGAGCSCHPTGCEYHRSTRVPLHPVWPRAASCTLWRTISASMRELALLLNPATK
jgi:hypothetical protein